MLARVVLVLSMFASQSAAEDKIVASYHDADFAEAKGNYNGISTASDGKVYYVWCLRRLLLVM